MTDVWGGIAILLTCGLVIAPTGFDLGFGAETLKFGTSLRTSPHHALPLLAATEKGFWKREIFMGWVSTI